MDRDRWGVALRLAVILVLLTLVFVGLIQVGLWVAEQV